MPISVIGGKRWQEKFCRAEKQQKPYKPYFITFSISFLSMSAVTEPTVL
jgi:hypothetical protein